jgi:hypothetical protein
MLPSYRDTGPYTGRNSSKGALIPEIARVIQGLREGKSLEALKQSALDGDLFTQRARDTRYRIWRAIRYMYLS